MMKHISEIIKAVTETMAVTLFAAITIIVLIQVFFRFVLHNALPWPEEATRFMLIWGAQLSFNIIIIENLNINVSYFQDKMPKNIREYLLSFILFLQLIFLGVVVWYGFKYASMGIISRSPAMGVPMIIPYIAVPIGGIFSIFQVIIKIRSRNLFLRLEKDKN